MINYVKILKFLSPVIIGLLIWNFFSSAVLYIYIAALVVWVFFRNLKHFFSYFGQIANVKGLYEKASKWYYLSYLLDKKNISIANDAAYTNLRLGNLDMVKSILSSFDISRLEGESKIKFANNIAILKWKSGDLEGAVKILESLYAQNDLSTSLFGNYPYLLMLNGEIKKARTIAEEAFAFNPKDIVIIENLARISFLDGDLEAAGIHFETLELLSPGYPEAWYNLALYYLGISENEKAQNALKSGLKCNFTFLSNVTKVQLEDLLKKISTAQLQGSENSQK